MFPFPSVSIIHCCNRHVLKVEYPFSYDSFISFSVCRGSWKPIPQQHLCVSYVLVIIRYCLQWLYNNGNHTCPAGLQVALVTTNLYPKKPYSHTYHNVNLWHHDHASFVFMHFPLESSSLTHSSSCHPSEFPYALLFSQPHSLPQWNSSSNSKQWGW